MHLERSDLSRASAGYHDQQYKISFFDPNEDGNPLFNNVEYWLDIKKMKAQDGQASWKGPMTGRILDYMFIEDFAPDGISYDDARDRLCVDRQAELILSADVLPLADQDKLFDIGVPIEWKMETGDFIITKQDNNWNKLITRFYLKAKTNSLSAEVIEETWTDGEKQEEKTIIVPRKTDDNFDDQPLVTRSFFPKTRIRGRTLRKVLRSCDRLGIGGFALLYRLERRRI